MQMLKFFNIKTLDNNKKSRIFVIQFKFKRYEIHD